MGGFLPDKKSTFITSLDKRTTIGGKVAAIEYASPMKVSVGMIIVGVGRGMDGRQSTVLPSPRVAIISRQKYLAQIGSYDNGSSHHNNPPLLKAIWKHPGFIYGIHR
jgi:hypothetical protein